MLLEVRGLKKYFGDVRAVDGVDLDIEERKLTAIIGPNGAGKTTLINLLTGRIKPDGGRIIFDGKDITNRSPHARAKIGIARSFQLVTIFEGFSVLDNMRVAISSITGKSNRIFSSISKDYELVLRAEEVLKNLNLYQKRYVQARHLSHGDRKLLDVAIALALKPKLLLLDEPTSGIGSSEKGFVMETLKKAINEMGVTAVIIEHDMDVVFNYSDNIVVMNEGKVIATGSPAQVKTHKEVISVLLGVS